MDIYDNVFEESDGDTMKEEYVLQKIKMLLDERGWTLYHLAKESDINYATLKNLFQSGKLLTVPTLMRVCEGFGISMSEFFAEEYVSENQLTFFDKKLLEYFHRLRKNERQLVMDRISYGFCDCNIY